MRLIDADALTEEIQEKMNNGFPANENLSFYALSCIAHAPTVDVLEQIRNEIVEWRKEPARYIPNYDAYKRFLELIDKYKEDKE